jgi:hypothetical protein
MATINPTLKYVKIPKANPFRWLKAQNGLQDYFTNEISPFEKKVEYVNPFELTDPLNSQMVFDMDYVTAYTVQLINCHNVVKKTATTQVMYTDSDNWRYVHFNMIPGASFTPGIYYLKLTVTLYTGQIDYYITEPIELKATWENTIYIDYGHSENDFDMVWNRSGFLFSGARVSSISSATKPFTALYRLRLHGGYWSKDYTPSSDDVVYNDQSWNFKTVSSIPYEVKKVTFGDGRGIPNYIAGIINRIFACTNVSINSERINKIDGAKLEQINRPDKYPMAGWTIDVAKYSNDYADEYSQTMVQQPSGISNMIIGFNFYVN